jgi:hypothetical protein
VSESARAKKPNPNSKRRPSKKTLRVFAENLAAGETKKDAALAAGISEGNAKKWGCVNSQRPEVQEILAKASVKYDLGLERVLKELDRGLKEATPDGKHVEYLDRLDRLHGLTPREKSGDTGASSIVSALVEALDSARAAAALSRTAIPTQVVRSPA